MPKQDFQTPVKMWDWWVPHLPKASSEPLEPSPSFCYSQASRNAVLAIAELLKWKELKHVVKTRQTWKMADCLVRMSPRDCARPWALQLGLGKRSQSLELHPCSWLKNRAPRALLQAHLPFLHQREGRGLLVIGLLAGGATPATWRVCDNVHTLLVPPDGKGQQKG